MQSKFVISWPESGGMVVDYDSTRKSGHEIYISKDGGEIQIGVVELMRLSTILTDFIGGQPDRRLM